MIFRLIKKKWYNLFIIKSTPSKISFMNYEEAKQYKKEALQKADESVLQNFHIVITPSDTGESVKFIEDFLKSPESFNDKSCQDYCSNDEYEVVSFKKEKDDD
jgi:hypothetical protein